MKTSVACIPCFMRQTLDAARLASDDPTLHEAVLRDVLAMAAELDLSQPPPATGQQIHRIIRSRTGITDPYKALKDRFNRFALGWYPALKQRVSDAHDPFETAVRLAIAGNIIDFGLTGELTEADVEQAVEETLSASIDAVTLGALREAVASAGTILYIADNAGEIVFDRLLIETIPPEKVTVAVRGHAVINDATRADADAVGLTTRVTVIDSGSDAPGTLLTDVSDVFRACFDRADVVIAKGQGNYETLSDAPREVFFLLRAKCAVIADDIGCETGAVVVTRTDGVVQTEQTEGR